MSAATVHQLDPDHGRDPAIEQWLTEHAITFEWQPALRLDLIDEARSRNNQARAEALDDDVVGIYAHDMRRGDQFPPIIVHRSKRATKVVILSGNHRSAAARAAKRTTLPAYVVVDVDPEVQPAIAYFANRNHGKQLDRQERMRQAAHLVALGWTQTAAADAVGLKPSDVSKAMAVNDGTARASQLHLAREWATLPFGHRERLAALKADPVLAAAVELAFEAKLTQPQVAELVKAANAARSEVAAMHTVGELRESLGHQTQRAKFGDRKVGTTVYGKVKDAVFVLKGADPVKVAASIPNEDARRVLRKQLKETAQACMALDKAL